MTTEYSTIRIGLEPSDDASMRAYCDAERMTYAMFLRNALKLMMASTKRKNIPDIPSQKEIYGRLNKNSFSVRLTSDERASIVAFARSIGVKQERSFSRLARYAIKSFLRLSAPGHRETHTQGQGQSPTPDLADSLSP
jgi:hypothetical protein